MKVVIFSIFNLNHFRNNAVATSYLGANMCWKKNFNFIKNSVDLQFLQIILSGEVSRLPHYSRPQMLTGSIGTLEGESEFWITINKLK